MRGAGVLALALCASLVLGASPRLALAQQTRAEVSGYTVTSSHADVVAFLDSLEARARGKFVRGVIGTTTEGRDLPYVIASRPLVHTPAEARATGKPIVYVQGNIHGGEVEGKEALQALLRDLVLEDGPNALDSIVLIAVPIYNADGNDNWGPQARQRGSQDGPERIGQRPNAAGLDLNRDYIKNEAPETLASLRMFTTWDPDAFMDLHTTNGSYHGYALTYSPSLHPAAMVGELAPAGPWTRDTLLPELRRRVRARGFETFDYGNFSGVDGGRDDPASLRKGGWETYEHKPRFGTNYYGLRNGVAVLAEAYSHDPFERRVKSTTAFVDEFLSFIAEHADDVTARTRMAPASLAAGRDVPVPIRAEMTKTPFNAPVIVETLIAMGDTLMHETGVRRGYRRSGKFTPVTMPVYDRFDAVLTQELPEAWVLDASMTPIVDRLRAHGIVATQLTQAWRGSGERFVVDSVVKARRPFQGHQEVRLEGRWAPETLALSAGTWVIAGDQPLALLAAILLEPQSDDGLTTWNAFDDDIAIGAAHPVRRVLAPLPRP
ncbi:MAG TPA: M14 family metallopeptidase [Gemmatimonadaceae bacterium]|nr:M14 family metallopeptidase [Gemmatimonadaceae bacterium]